MSEKKNEEVKKYTLKSPAYVRIEPDVTAEKVRLAEASDFVTNNSYAELFVILKVGTKITPLEEKKIGNDLWLKIKDGWLLYK